MIQSLLFAAGSAVLTAISWKSLRRPGSHGFYRFFAWEAILALFLLNAASWFYRPFAWNQLIAWSLLSLSLLPLALGVHALRSQGRPAARREGEPALLAFEKTTALVTTGIYRYIRHPLYSSLLLLTWGVFFKAPGLPASLLAAAASVFLLATARADEKECLEFFGLAYRRYMQKTKRFLPYFLTI